MESFTKQDFSVVYWLKDLFSEYSFINIVEEYPEDGLQLPAIAVDMDTINLVPFELGSRDRLGIRTWFLDIYAKNKRQRNEMGYKIIEELEDVSIPINNYDEGFPPDVTPSVIGYLSVDDIELKIIQVLPELTEKMYYRSLVRFTTEYKQD